VTALPPLKIVQDEDLKCPRCGRNEDVIKMVAVNVVWCCPIDGVFEED
jgi:hypothetical protein